jgi:cytochrome P460
MKKQTLRLAMISCLIAAGAFCNLTAHSQSPAPTHSSFDLESLKSRVLNYKTWNLVTPQPAKMRPVVSQMCASVAPQPPQADKYLRVYVNDVGRDAMFQATNPKFPVGSIIVKEKLPSIDSSEAEFYTIMVKRESSYDPAHGNWQYLTMSGNRSSLEAPKNVASCQACHDVYRDISDSVVREYLHLR